MAQNQVPPEKKRLRPNTEHWEQKIPSTFQEPSSTPVLFPDLFSQNFTMSHDVVLASYKIIHNWQNGTVLIFSAVYRHPVAIVGETHSAGTVCSSQLNYFNIAKKKHANTVCRIQMQERIYTWVFCEVFVVRNFNFLLVWIVCSHIHLSLIHI